MKVTEPKKEKKKCSCSKRLENRLDLSKIWFLPGIGGKVKGFILCTVIKNVEFVVKSNSWNKKFNIIVLNNSGIVKNNKFHLKKEL